MRNLKDYIMIVDDVLAPDICQELIDKFEPELKIFRDQDWGTDYRCFNELNITQLKQFDTLRNHLYEKSQQMYELYKNFLKIPFFPEMVGFEDLRMKRYDNNDYDQFGWHTDVGDALSARRFLVMFYYLNTVEEGGETVFNDFTNEDGGLYVQPKQGRIVMFPPMWMYPHIGTKPVSNNKYIISTYGQYQ